MKEKRAVDCDAEWFPLDWIPAGVLRDLYIVVCHYYRPPDCSWAPIREPRPEWRIPFSLVKTAFRLELRGFEARVIGSVRILGVSVQAPPPDLRYIVAAEIELPVPPEAQASLDLAPPSSRRDSSAVPEESPRAPDSKVSTPRR